jgi:SAM-dependent methyltransferase
VSRAIPFDRAADYYDETRGGVERGRRNAAALHPWLPPGPVVEIGVGTGLVAAALAERGTPVLGLDLSVPMLRRARERLPNRIACADAARLPIRTASVAAMYFVHVVHLLDLEAAFREAHRVLQPEGRLLVLCAADRPPESDVARILDQLRAGLGRGRADEPGATVGAANGNGFRLEHREERGHQAEVTPLQAASRAEARMWAWTWDLDDDVWERHARRALQRLRSLPDPEQPRPTREDRTLLVFRSAAADRA